MAMKLMTKAIEKKIPKLYSTEEIPMEEKKIYVKFFSPAFTWYAAEYCPVERIFFGYVANESDPTYSEWGLFLFGRTGGNPKTAAKPFLFP